METKIYVTPENDPRDYVDYDLCGYPFNKKYPPNKNVTDNHTKVTLTRPLEYFFTITASWVMM